MPTLAERGITQLPEFKPAISAYQSTDRRVDTATETSLLRKPHREKVGSDAFNLEYDTPPTRAELRRDIVSYLGEYRLQVQKYNYDLVFGRDKDHRGEVTLRDIDRGSSLHHMAKKTLESRSLEGKPTHREEAEKIGLERLNDLLRTSQDGDTIVWASPPGPKEQGYGEYGFLYKGTVRMLDNGERFVPMTANRIEKPKPYDQNLNKNGPWIPRVEELLNNLTGESTTYQCAEDFLASPQLIRKEITNREVDHALQTSFDFTPNDAEQQKMKTIIKKMDPLIEEFISRMETGNKEERLKAFHALENYALVLKKQQEEEQKQKVIFETTISFDNLLEKHGHRPPPVSGSCGSTGEIRSNGLMSVSGSSRLGSLLSGPSSRESANDMKCVTCPFCKEMVDAIVTATTITCPECRKSVNK